MKTFITMCWHLSLQGNLNQASLSAALSWELYQRGQITHHITQRIAEISMKMEGQSGEEYKVSANGVRQLYSAIAYINHESPTMLENLDG